MYRAGAGALGSQCLIISSTPWTDPPEGLGCGFISAGLEGDFVVPHLAFGRVIVRRGADVALEGFGGRGPGAPQLGAAVQRADLVQVGSDAVGVRADAVIRHQV